MYFFLFIFSVCVIGGIIYAAKNPDTWYYGVVIATVIPLFVWFCVKAGYAGILHNVVPDREFIPEGQSYLTTLWKVLKQEFVADAKSSGKAMGKVASGTMIGTKNTAKSILIKKYTEEEKRAERAWLEENKNAIKAMRKFNLKEIPLGGSKRRAAIALVAHTKFETFEDVPLHMLHKYPFSDYARVAPSDRRIDLKPTLRDFQSSYVSPKLSTIKEREEMRKVYTDALRKKSKAYVEKKSKRDNADMWRRRKERELRINEAERIGRQRRGY